MDKERMEISREPEPGYRIAFYIVSLVAVFYLGVIFF
jgi:hypothetical protein